MFSTFKIWRRQGKQFIPDVTKVNLPEVFRGMPVISDVPCEEGCSGCADACPTEAISLNPVKLDLGRCVFCGECERGCPAQKIKFTPDFKTATNDPELLVVKEGNAPKMEFNAKLIRQEITDYFHGSLKLRQISAAGCNGCEAELNAAGNVNFDMGRFGIDFVASPRHADGIVITGPISENMSRATETCYIDTPDPKLIILVGACAISGGIFRDSPALNRSFLNGKQVDLYVPGCPPHPLTFINGVLQFIRSGKKLRIEN